MRHPESMDLVAAEVREQMSAQLRHLERQDAQAGVLLGFAGLFVALAPESQSLWLAAARFVAVVAAVGALLTFLARTYEVIDLAGLREMASTDPALARLVLLDTHIVLVERARHWTDHKARQLTLTTCALFVAIALAVVGLVVDNPP